MGQTIKADIGDGEQEFELVGNHSSNVWGITHQITVGGDIVPHAMGNQAYYKTAYLRLVRKQHTFGLLTLEETDEVRHANYGDFVLDVGSVCPWLAPYASSQTYPILRPVAIEAQP